MKNGGPFCICICLLMWYCFIVLFCCSIDKNNAVAKELKRLLKIPVDSYNNILTLLQLENFAPLFDYFDYASRKEMAHYLVLNAVENEIRIPTQEQVNGKKYLLQ